MNTATARTQFKIGDKAVYPTKGVAEVVNIEERDIAGDRQRFYVLKVMNTEHRIMVPVKKAEAVGLRSVISESEVQEILEILRETPVTFDHQTWNRRYRGFMDKLRTGSIYDVAEVMRDLSWLRATKALSSGEKKMLETARALIVKEIAVSRGAAEPAVTVEIEAIFQPN